MEQNLRRALSISNGGLSILWQSRISIGLWLGAAAMLALPPLYRAVARQRGARAGVAPAV